MGIAGKLWRAPRHDAKAADPLPLLQHGRILQAAAEATGCPHPGLLPGRRAALETAGPLRHLVLNAGTQREAVETVVRFAQLWHPAMKIGLADNNGDATLAQTRADMATTMLQHTAMPIGDIALALGYSTSTGFGRAFTRWFGKSPKDWRKRMLGIRRSLAPAAVTALRAA